MCVHVLRCCRERVEHSRMSHKLLSLICAQSYHTDTYNIGECEVLVKQLDGVQVIAFRGTETGAMFAGAGWVDVLRDLRITPWYDKDTGWMHEGFLVGGRRAAAYLKGKLNPDIPVICTGHSLGGALALVCAVKLQAAGFTIDEWVGFGSPKTQLSKREHNFTQWNYRHKADVVPLMARCFGYRHNYPVINLQPNPCREPTWDDHGINQYIAAL